MEGGLEDPISLIVAICAVFVGFLVVWARTTLAPPPKVCPQCGKSESVSLGHTDTPRYLYTRADGTPDQRYKRNPRTDTYWQCLCGWLDPNEIARREGIVVAQREREEAEKRRKEQEEQEAPAKAVVWLLKYVASADRKFMEGERQAIIRLVRDLFPDHREAAIAQWAEELAPDPFHLQEKLAMFGDSDASTKKVLLELCTEMTSADGKATKAEKARLDEIRKGLGL